jgi:proline racemase
MVDLVSGWPASVGEWLKKTDRQTILAVDSHTGGNPTRIVMSGIELPSGTRTVDTARAWLRDQADHWRRRLVHEPRGGGLTCAVLPIATKEDGCDIGAVILEPGSYPPMCGHCMIGFACVIVELHLLPNLWTKNDREANFKIRTPAGPVGVTAHRENGHLTTITLTNVASYVVERGETTVAGKTIPVELLYGGDYYITVDADAIDLSLDRDNATEIVHFARQLRTAYTKDGVRDPITGGLLDVYQVMFFRRLSDQDGKRAKIVVVAPPGVIDRSPCGTGSSALFSKFVTDGEIAADTILTTQSIIGSTFTVAAQDLSNHGGRRTVTPLLTGRAYINGFLTIAADSNDSLADGFAPL